MNFRIANTFTESLTRLTNQEQKLTKTKAFDLQVDPTNTGKNFHRIDKVKDKNFWSVYVNMDIRIIVHKTENNFLLCYVDHHEKAYAWAETRKLETHPATGAAQIVEMRETIKEIEVPKYIEVEKQPEAPRFLFDKVPADELLAYGVPPEWIEDVMNADEKKLYSLVDYLPEEASEALLKLAVGEKPELPKVLVSGGDPFEHPDAQRRFRIMNDVKELELALNYPWEKWSIFLHPEQRKIVQKEFNGPARVSGSAGTGKTVVALHRAVFLARIKPEARVLLTTFSDNLASMLKNKLHRLISETAEPELAERIEVFAMDALGKRLYHRQFQEKFDLAIDVEIKKILSEKAGEISNHNFSETFLFSEWKDVVDAWQIKTWEEYKNVQRLGRKKRLPESQRIILWDVFQKTQAEIKSKKKITTAKMFTKLADRVSQHQLFLYDYTIVDESQDISIPQLKLLAVLAGNRSDGLFFAGDLGQRIFQQPFSWNSLGINIRGRSQILRINYRTSHQIRAQADKLMGLKISDVDGNEESRKGTVSVFNGPPPEVKINESYKTEVSYVSEWLKKCKDINVLPHEVGVFVRTENEFERAKSAIISAGLNYQILDNKSEPDEGYVSLCTMHLAKGLEFKAVVVMACDDEVIPLQSRIEAIGDFADIDDVYDTEKNLLYVACTRARDYLLISGVDPASEFLDDLQ